MFNADRSAKITVLTDKVEVLDATIVQCWSRRVRLSCDQALPISVPVQVAVPNALLWGEISFVQDSHGVYLVDVELEQALHDVEQLASLVKRIMRD